MVKSSWFLGDRRISASPELASSNSGLTNTPFFAWEVPASFPQKLAWPGLIVFDPFKIICLYIYIDVPTYNYMFIIVLLMPLLQGCIGKSRVIHFLEAHPSPDVEWFRPGPLLRSEATANSKALAPLVYPGSLAWFHRSWRIFTQKS